MAPYLLDVSKMAPLVGLVECGFLNAIDDNDFDRSFRGHQSQAELFLNGRENCWTGEIRWWGRTLARWDGRADWARALANVGRPLKFDVVKALQAGLVDHGPAQLSGERGHEVR